MAVLCGCGRPLPPALALPDATRSASEEAAAPTTRAEALASVIGRDPLARTPRFASVDRLRAIPGADALVQAAEVLPRAEQGEAAISRLQEAEDAARGTELTALVRGTRLGMAERLLAERAGMGTPELADLTPLLSRLRTDPLAHTRAKHPLQALEPDQDLALTAQRLGARWVLAGWLDGPSIPLEGVNDALDGAPFDGLRESPLGRIVVARAAGLNGPTDAGLVDLHRATGLALQRAAADRHSEQGKWADAREAAANELGTDDPVGFLLDRAYTRLLSGAGSSLGAGGALLAATALRLDGRCADRPCRSLDRVETLVVAGGWDPAITPLARAWAVIALKSALDTLDVGHDTTMFRTGLVDLVDALMGTGAAAPPAGVLARTAEEPAVWQLVGASVGDRSAATWDAVRVPLGRHLANEVRIALEGADPSHKPFLDRILERAVP